MNPRSNRLHCTGFSMVEIMVSMIILLVGLLGLAGLQTRSQQAEMESYQRAQALVLLQDMVDRINTNRKVAACYAITTDTAAGSPWLGSSSSVTPACTSGTTQQNNLAIADMTIYNNLLTGSAETSGVNKIGGMTGARGCITTIGANIYLVAIAWQGLNASAAPTVNCAKDQYGSDEKLRRVVYTTVQIQ